MCDAALFALNKSPCIVLLHITFFFFASVIMFSNWPRNSEFSVRLRFRAPLNHANTIEETVSLTCKRRSKTANLRLEKFGFVLLALITELA